jgi:hypothetical protein
MGGIGEETPPEPARSVDPAAMGSLANSKNWKLELSFVQLHWSKRPDGSWWRFADVAPQQLEGCGVFAIWRIGSAVTVSTVLYVGRGSLRDEFARCHRDSIFSPDGLYVTWAAVHDMRLIDPIGAYLYHQLHPLWGEAVLAPPMPVNLPLTA